MQFDPTIDHVSGAGVAAHRADRTRALLRHRTQSWRRTVRWTVATQDIRTTCVALTAADAKLTTITVISRILATDRGELALLRQRLDASGKI
jgi:hypothetical protein